ncbi:MAG: ABC transporter permease [Ethanoligenens sp.]
MRRFWLFTVKECVEQVRTFKGIAIFLVLLFFGISSPLMAKLTPDLLKLAVTVPISIPAPTAADAYAQFFKNVGQIGFLVVLLIASGCVAIEASKGTVRLMLTRGLSRTAFILLKFTCAVLVWSVSYAVAAGLCAVYTVLLFPNGRLSHVVAALFCLWFFGVLTLAAAVFCSAVSPSYLLSAVGSVVLWGMLLACAAFPILKDDAPSALVSRGLELLNGLAPERLLAPVLWACALTVGLLTAACIIFRTRDL